MSELEKSLLTIKEQARALGESIERAHKLEALIAERDAMLGRRPCQNSRCNELNAARALLREIIDAGGTVSIKLDDKVQLYLDACDKPGGA